MKKLAGLLTFAVALVGAIFLTQYYSRNYGTPPAPPAPPAQPAAPPVTGSGAVTMPPPTGSYAEAGRGAITFKPQAVALDAAGGKAYATLTLEREPARPTPAGVWVWAYFFTADAPGRYCAGDPVEVQNPFGRGEARATVKVEMSVKGCPAPRTPASTYYARFNVSAESAFAARLAEPRISYDITQAAPVVLRGSQK